MGALMRLLCVAGAGCLNVPVFSVPRAPEFSLHVSLPARHSLGPGTHSCCCARDCCCACITCVAQKLEESAKSERRSLSSSRTTSKKLVDLMTRVEASQGLIQVG